MPRRFHVEPGVTAFNCDERAAGNVDAGVAGLTELRAIQMCLPPVPSNGMICEIMRSCCTGSMETSS